MNSNTVATMRHNESLIMFHGEMQKTSRGFEIVKFSDAYNAECEIQQSSGVGDYPDAFEKPGSSFLWIGTADAEPKIMKSQAIELGVPLPPGEVSGWMPYPIPSEVLLNTRMHLNREQVGWLVKCLNHWLQTGSLNAPE
jgi:hypothetical protein